MYTGIQKYLESYQHLHLMGKLAFIMLRYITLLISIGSPNISFSRFSIKDVVVCNEMYPNSNMGNFSFANSSRNGNASCDKYKQLCYM